MMGREVSEPNPACFLFLPFDIYKTRLIGLDWTLTHAQPLRIPFSLPRTHLYTDYQMYPDRFSITQS